MARTGTSDTLEELCSSKEIVLSTGSGGVGKTTTAAAVAVAAARHTDRKVLVLTVDPARRLANALGMEQFGNVETRVLDDGFTGELWAAMLDTKQSWDDLIRLHAPDAATRDEILANPLYANITGKFVQSHDYIAMERLYEIHSSGRYDLIIVDTPPTRNAVDFLDAPERMADFFSSRLLRWLIAPYRSRMVNFASKPFYSVADRVLGTQFLEDIARFFILFQSMYDGFVERANAVSELLARDVTTFLVISTLEVAPVREAEYFLRLLAERDHHIGAVVLNKVLPELLLDPQATAAAEVLLERSDELQPDIEHGAHVLQEIASSFCQYQVVARREAAQRDRLATRAELSLSVPYFAEEIHSLDGLTTLGETIWR